MNTFALTISAFNKSIYNDQAVSCRIVTPSGALALEANHETFLAILKEHSTIRYKEPSGTERTCKIESDMLSFKNNICLVAVCLPVFVP